MFKATGTGTYLKVRQRRNGILYPLPCPPSKKRKKGGSRIDLFIDCFNTRTFPRINRWSHTVVILHHRSVRPLFPPFLFESKHRQLLKSNLRQNVKRLAMCVMSIRIPVSQLWEIG